MATTTTTATVPKIRIGRTFKITWPVTIDGGLVPLAEATLEVELKDKVGRTEILEHIISDDGKSLICTVDGRKDRTKGNYWLTCWYDRTGTDRSMVDRVHAFTLVESTEEEDIPTDTDITVTAITLEGDDITAAVKGDKGDDGKSPYIGDNGDWYQYNDETKQYEDTGIKAHGEDAVIDYATDAEIDNISDNNKTE